MAKEKVLSLCPSMINTRNYAQNMGINARRITLVILVKFILIIINSARGIENKLRREIHHK